MHNSGASRREKAEVYLAVIARSEATEAIHSFSVWQDGLLRFARNDGSGFFDNEVIRVILGSRGAYHRGAFARPVGPPMTVLGLSWLFEKLNQKLALDRSELRFGPLGLKASGPQSNPLLMRLHLPGAQASTRLVRSPAPYSLRQHQPGSAIS